ncbi:hypothetical protein K525DRAFT_145144, partial [Schizophyllum commune Loenen D]
VAVFLVSGFSRLLPAPFRILSSTFSVALHSQHPRVMLPQAHCEWGGSPGGSRSARQCRGGHDETHRSLTPPPFRLHGCGICEIHVLWDGAERRP